jgi:hypothetical protein
LPVQVKAPEALIGSIGSVVIEAVGPNSLFGRLAGVGAGNPWSAPTEVPA